MIIFDELSFANRMLEKGFIKCFSIYELSVYAKYLKSINKENDEIEAELISFSKKWNKDFIYEVDYPKIDKAVKSIDEYSLRIAKPVYVTENEWNKIMELNNEKYRRVLFTMLVISKYYKSNNTKITKDEKPDDNNIDTYNDTYFCNFSDVDILKLSGVKFREKDEKTKMFNYFYKNDFIDITQGKKSIRIIKIINSDGKIKETITDYDNIILYYERLVGEKIGECKECGKLFRQSKSNNGQYCYKHRGYKPQEYKTITCIDCEKDVVVDSKDNETCRCESCKGIYIKKRDKIRKRKYRENLSHSQLKSYNT